MCRVWKWLFVLTACGDHHDEPSRPDARPDARDELAGSQWVGVDNQAAFYLELGNPGRTIAQGSRFSIEIQPRSTAPMIVSATADGWIIDPPTYTDPYTFVSFVATAPLAGDPDFVLRDASGAEIDRYTMHVRPSDELAFDGPVRTATVLAESTASWHLTTKREGNVTVGTGAVTFTLNGLAPGNPADVGRNDGDRVLFEGGTGSIDAFAPDASAHIDLTAVALAELTSITPAATDVSGGDLLRPYATASIRVDAGSSPVYGAACMWSQLGRLTVSKPYNGGVGGDASLSYDFFGPAGDYTPLCQIGQLSTMLHVHLHDL